VREQQVPLSRLIDVVNERFGTDFNQADQLFFDQIIEAAMTDDALRQAAVVNPGEKFQLLFKNVLERLFVDRMDQNEDIFVRFMNDMPFQKLVTAWMSDEAYRRLRTDVATGDAEKARPALRLVDAGPKARYVTCLPLVPLKAAAGVFSDPQHVEEDDFEWIEFNSNHRLRQGMFVAQVVGKSMEPVIPDGAFCLFTSPVTGTRQGKTVLVQLRDVADPETGFRYSVKRYESEKQRDGDSWRHSKIVLKPVNPAFSPIVLAVADEGAINVIAEFIEVLSSTAPVREG
jgi:hypothetical protein